MRNISNAGVTIDGMEDAALDVLESKTSIHDLFTVLAQLKITTQEEFATLKASFAHE